ncbi:hypothetical protein KAFR_0D03630 [Kazachstania africana CBS 2517]|uniref:BHLH domain-containing protein n=1 Tax=Kazachstania africana (strain ATCC 22294 / BCRC 22015 / CBS 2517 / CECT 1963 / NBRC 1671 / NRRL Y-8276) TaxID=1071382 RepID=H2AUG1_KAZAF|nr:hypothetical protein KAFR_0D03630 [Kazachstania africana CBS 2517]CCF58011.1 hypothetical protein KAFR_0D03630 [Kazachstania africana CBS 2517]
MDSIDAKRLHDYDIEENSNEHEGSLKKQKTTERDDEEEGNIDSELLNAETHYHEDDDATAAAAAAVTATYNELLQHREQHHNAEDESHVVIDDDIIRAEDIPESARKDSEAEKLKSNHDNEKYDDKLQDKEGEEGEEGVHDSKDEMIKSMTVNRRGRKPMAISGSEEWKRQRKDSHKEVERRRRENINTAIDALSSLLPIKESSKAAILTRAAEYIEKLKETENANIEKWTLQKLLSEQSASQLVAANEKLQEELGNAYKEIEHLKRQLKKHGILDTEETATGSNNDDNKKNKKK